MKQNLIQKQIRLSTYEVQKNNTIVDVNDFYNDTVDFTTKAFFIANQILESDFLFSKRALATFLHGKPIVLQQKGNQRPPSTLKAYMSLYDDVTIEKLIDLMIDLNILGEKKINLKQRSTKRLFTTKKFQFNTFPKVSMKVNTKRSIIQLPFTIKKQKSLNEKTKQPKQPKQKQKSRLSSFLFTKTSLPVNLQKKQVQLKIKTQKQREQYQERKRKQQQQIRLKRLQQAKTIEYEKQRELQLKRKQQQKQLHINKMNNFWLKQKQKIQQFISPSKLKSPTIKGKQRQQQRRKHQQNSLQMAGNILQVQMKQLKEQEEQKKNLIKPYISWSFVKNTLGIDSSQSNNNQKIQQSVQPVVVMEVKKQKVSHQKMSDKKSSSSQKSIVKNVGYCTINKDKQQKDLIQQKTPFLGLPLYLEKQKQNDNQQHSLSFNNTQSTDDVTMTNYRLQKINKKKSKDQNYSIQKYNNQRIFAKDQQDSMFSNSYYCQSHKDKGQQTVTNKKIQKSDKEKHQNKKERQCFTFKRRSTLLANQQTCTVAKKNNNQRSFINNQHQDMENQDQLQQKFFKRHKKQQLLNEDEIQLTLTLAMPKKKLSQKRKTKNSMQIVFSQDIPYYEVQLFSQTKTTPQPKTKNKKISTSDLFPIKSQFQQKEFKRDSFVQELINDYYKKKA